MKLVILGFGHMGQALYQRLKTVPDLRIKALDRTPSKVTESGCAQATETDIAQADYLLLGIKPQGLAEVVVPELKHNAIVISMLAGTSITKLNTKFDQQKIVRIMPNLPVAQGQGVVGWCSADLDQNQKTDLETLLTPLGLVLELESEHLLDKLTLLSGSGPGYLAFMIDALEQAAVKLGFSPEQAEKILTQTLVGTTLMLQKQSAADLTKQVSSKGGVTEAITQQLTHDQIPKHLQAALQAGLEKINDLKKTED